LALVRDGRITDVLWDGPAFKMGLTVGSQAIAVGGMTYAADFIKSAIKEARNNNLPIEIQVKNGDRYRAVRFDYHDGLRYPSLERVANTPARECCPFLSLS
jgi:predicted metalloprotease with PDZ domain